MKNLVCCRTCAAGKTAEMRDGTREIGSDSRTGACFGEDTAMPQGILALKGQRLTPSAYEDATQTGNHVPSD